MIFTFSYSFEPNVDLSLQWADRHRVIGFDQLLLVTPPPTPDVDFGYRIFNPDGSEVQQCGNGVRCLAHFVRQRAMCHKDSIRVASPTNIMTVQYETDGRFKVDMGKPNLSPSALPFIYPQKQLRYELEIDQQIVYFGAVSMGNPHIVIAVSDLDAIDVTTLGSQLSFHSAFPEQVNVSFMQCLSRGKIKLRVFERGAGETLACGSAACAAVVIGELWEMLDTQVEVILPGGSLSIDWKPNQGTVYMTGSAQYVFDGKIAPSREEV
ncbi:MAG: diaminopimelate epimerase [Legionellales bacterium]|nr:diaminopimelate epimerase [Legionellales bacterium]